MDKHAKVFVAGHRGMVGSAILCKLQAAGYDNIITVPRNRVDLCRQEEVECFFRKEKPQYIFLAAAKVGGIHANSVYPAEFFYDNLMIELNVIHSAWQNGAHKLLFLGSSCIYPRMAPQPIPENALLSGPLESTNEAYALSKIAGIKMCEFYNRQYGTDFISAMPTNLYGPGDNYHPENSHVLPALIRRFHEAKVENLPYVTIWGTGKPLREFLYVNDLADACLLLMNRYSGDETINVGSGQELSIAELAALIASIIGYNGEIHYDPEKPDGTPRKRVDISKLEDMGWAPSTQLEAGIRATYVDFTMRMVE